MTFRTQISPTVSLGNLADLPNPATFAQGAIFHAVDTGQTFILHILTSTGARQWDALTTITTIGGTGLTTTYAGGTVVPPTVKNASFTASPTEATSYEITATGEVVTLNVADAVGTRYEFSENTGNAAPNTTFTPNGGKFITGPGGVNAASQNVNVQGYFRAVTKLSNGNWLLSGL